MKNILSFLLVIFLMSCRNEDDNVNAGVVFKSAIVRDYSNSFNFACGWIIDVQNEEKYRPFQQNLDTIFRHDSLKVLVNFSLRGDSTDCTKIGLPRFRNINLHSIKLR